ncbi:MAG: exonuclease domain-containing protein [Burkholderiaceae bacterium]|nr:exonuclease domain-containing protein [Burkholderiaceae bacterium]
MKPPVDRAALAAAAAPGAVLAAALSATAALLGATLEPAERAAAWALLEPRLALVLMLWLVAAIALGTLARRLWLRHGGAAGRLAETVQVLRLAPPGRRLEAAGQPRGAHALAEAVNALLAEREELLGAIDRRVAEAADGIAQERNRLAALMAELTQSVVVCNLDGRVLLFNARARLQFRALAAAQAEGAIGGAEPLALGRSIYAALDRRLVAHALDSVQQRLARGATHASATFVTGTRGGQLLRAQLAPVRAQAAGAPSLDGFVLMLDNVTHDLGDEMARDRALHRLTEGQRAALGNLRAAVELLDEPDLPPPVRERFFAIVRDEIGTMTRQLQEAAAAGLQAQKTRWPLEDMLGADLVDAAVRRLQAAGGPRVGAGEVDPALWLRVDSYSLLQALAHLAGRLAGEYGVARLTLRLQPTATPGDGKAWLDLAWPVQAMSTEAVSAWETEPIVADGQAQALSVRDVLDRHGGTLWFERGRARPEAFFRLLLPQAVGAGAAAALPLALPDSRPEFYDFELFGRGAGGGLLERPLAELAFTVFDTETTGLDPAGGDEIIQIGATRIVAGKLRRESVFEQLVDPQRSVPEVGIAIHGIRPEQLAGQPTIDAVLPAFADFAADTVLVAYNAAFDMRFLQIKEARTGVRFEQPVLDTLLLSAVLHPGQGSHGLEAIAERLGVPVLGRHTALGDAIVTAEVFVKMMPLLRERGLVTLGQVLEASRATWLARVQY